MAIDDAEAAPCPIGGEDYYDGELWWTNCSDAGTLILVEADSQVDTENPQAPRPRDTFDWCVFAGTKVPVTSALYRPRFVSIKAHPYDCERWWRER